MPAKLKFDTPKWSVAPYNPEFNYSELVFRSSGPFKRGSIYTWKMPDGIDSAQGLKNWAKNRRGGASWSDTMCVALWFGMPLNCRLASNSTADFAGFGAFDWGRGIDRFVEMVLDENDTSEHVEGDIIPLNLGSDYAHRQFGKFVERDGRDVRVQIWRSSGYDTDIDYIPITRVLPGKYKPKAATAPGEPESENQFLHCSHCGGEMASESNSLELAHGPGEAGAWICPTCVGRTSSVLQRCAHCNKIHPRSSSGYCEYCEAHIYRCACCGNKKDRRRDPAHDVNTPIVGEAPVCHYCYVRARHLGLAGHDYKPERLNFFAQPGDITLGLEMEMDADDGTKRDAVVPYLQMNTGLGGNKERYFIKSDGSLECGLEWVFHPHSLVAFKAKEAEFRAILSNLRKGGMRSHDTKTCGLHIHVGKDRLGITETYQRLALEKLIFLGDKFYINLLKFSRRNKELMDSWAGPQINEGRASMQEACYVFKDASINRDGRRRKGINLTNRDTVEFRFFRGTLVWKTIFATMQLVQNMVELAKDFTIPIEAVSWEMIINHNDDKILKEYWETRKDTKIVMAAHDEPKFDDENPDKE